MSMSKFVIGVDFGTDSVRSVLVNAGNGKEVASSVFNFPRWKQGLYCNAASIRYSARIFLPKICRTLLQ